MISKILKISISLLIVAGLVIGGIKTLKKAKAKDANMPQAKIYPLVVKQFIPKTEEVKLTLPYLAEVANDKDVKLSSRIVARVLYLKKSGSHVRKGEVVITLDTTSIKSALASVKKQLHAAKISLKNLEATHKRTLELLKVQGASIEESQKEMSMIANTQASVASLRQKAIELKNNLSYAKIISPVNGLITKTFVSKGGLSAPGKALVAISSKNGFYLLVRVPSQLPIVGVNFNNKEYSAIPLNSTFHGLAEYKVYMENHKLISGDRIEVDVVTLNQKALLLPFDTLLNRDGKSYVLVIDGNKAHTKEVHILQSAQEGVVISDNLEGKKIVMAKPDILLRLSSGYALKIEE